MIKYMLPGLDNHMHIIKQLLFIKDAFPHFFKEDVQIGAVYGNFQYSIWDGGRIFEKYHNTTSNEIFEIKQLLNNNNIPLRLVFTNPILEKKHLNDHFCNLVSNICESEMNEIVVNSPLLEEYLRNKYPKYKFISSTTKCNKKEDSLNELSKNYYLICLDYNLNKNFTFLESIPLNQRDKIEFLINAICPPGCPNRKNHYRLNGISHLNLGKKFNLNCILKENTVANSTIHYKNNISPEEIENYYIKNNFYNFKIEGRTLPDLEIVENFARYLIKPEHQLHFILCFHTLLTKYNY